MTLPEPARPRLQPATIVEVLAQLWPACFTTDPRERRPLKIGIAGDIEAAACGALTQREIDLALGWYVRGGSYLWRMRPGADRIGLDGKPAGTVSDADAEHARARLAALKARRRPITKPGRSADAGAIAAQHEDMQHAGN